MDFCRSPVVDGSGRLVVALVATSLLYFFEFRVDQINSS